MILDGKILATFADQIHAAIGAMDEAALRGLVASLILEAGYLSPYEKSYVALPKELRNQIEAAHPSEAVDETQQTQQFLSDIKGYSPQFTRKGDCSVGTYSYSPEDGWNASLTEEELCDFYNGHLVIFKDEKTIVEITVGAELKLEAVDDTEVEKKLDELNAEITWHVDPSKHVALVEVLPDIMAQAELPQCLLEFLQGVGTLTETEDLYHDNIRVQIRTRTPKRKRKNEQLPEAKRNQ